MNNPFITTKLCRIQGNCCNLCTSHCENGDTICPKGHQKGYSYTGILCQETLDGRCSICRKLIKKKTHCLIGHIIGEGYNWQITN